MVKVQKPQPKTLSKGPGKDGGGVTKKAKVEKSKKLTKTEAIQAAATLEIKNKKEKKTVKDTKPAKEVTEKQSKASKKPLVLAPLVSPSPAKKPSKSKSAVASAPAKKPLKLTSVLPEIEKKNETKKQKTKVSQPQASPPAAAPSKKTAEKTKKPVKSDAPAASALKKQSAPTSAGIEKKNESKKQKKAKEAVIPETVAPAKPALKKTVNKGEKAAKPVASSPPTAKETAKPTKKPTKTAAPATTPAPSKKGEQKKQDKQTKPAQSIANKGKKEQSKPGSKVKAQKISKSIKPGQSPVKKAAKPKAKSIGNKKSIKGKKNKKAPLELKFEIKPYDEQKFQEIVSESNVLKICEALKTQVEAEVKKQKATSIFSDYRYILQVTGYKIPSCPKRMVKLGLKHSLVGNNDDVAIIVTDLQRGAKFEVDPTIQHYEDLLREVGIEQRLTVVPFNQLRNDVGSFEAKRKFLNTYDYLMCDGRLSGQASAYLGKFTQKPRNVLHPVRLSVNKSEIKKEISRALCRTAYRQLTKGDLIAIPVGNHEHSPQQLADNILLVAQQLKSLYPGGLANVRSIYVKIDITGTSALPLYISMCAPPADTPYVVGPREQRMLQLKKQANEVLSRFALTKDAEFVKLTSEQVKRKAEVREKRAAVMAEDAAQKENDDEDSGVPAKKARKESSKKQKKEVEPEEEEAVEEDEDEDEDEEDGSDDDENEEEDEDEDEEDDDDDDDDE